MFQVITKIMKWVSIPALIVIALLSFLAGRYEALMNLIICLTAVAFVRQAARQKNYFWGATCVGVFVVFSPFLLVTKIFLLMGLTSIVACLTVVAAFRPQPVPAL